MYKLSLLVLLAVVAASQGYSEKQVGQLSIDDLYSNNSPLGIYKGKKTTIEKHPYMVVIHINNTIVGAAAIVSKRWVIFAAGFSGVPMNQITLIAGSSDGYTGKKYSLKKLVLHPKFFLGKVDYDYCLAQIKGTFKWSKKTKPIKLATKQPKTNTPMVVASWGVTSPTIEGEASNSAMMEGTMKWMSLSACKAAYKGYRGITFTPRLACVYTKGKTTLCKGDWSTPIVNKNLLYGYFIGTDTTMYCSPRAKPDVLANVPRVASWIKKITGAKTEDDEY